MLLLMMEVHMDDGCDVDVGIANDDVGCFEPCCVSSSMMEVDIDDRTGTYKLSWHG